MSLQAVAPSAWAEVIAQFSRAHRGWLASLEEVRPGPELAFATAMRPLRAVTAAPLGPIGSRPVWIRIELEGSPAVRIRCPRAIRVDTTARGAEQALEVDGAAGELVRLVFRATALPEPDPSEPVGALQCERMPAPKIEVMT